MKQALFKLDATQLSRKAVLETTIRDGLDKFQAVGEALAEIRNAKLYADEFETFEEYLSEKWKMGKSQGYRLIDAASVARNVSPIGDVKKILPSESVAREIAKVPECDQRKVAKVLVKVAAGRPITAAVAKAAVEHLKSAPRGGLAAMAKAVTEPAQPEIDLNLKPKMTPVAKAQAIATIQEWYEANRRRLNEHPAANPETMVRRIVALFQ